MSRFFSFVLMVSLSFGVLRIGGMRDDIFKDMAHIWVGFLIGFAFGSYPENPDRGRVLFFVAGWLTAVEVVVGGIKLLQSSG